MTLFRRLVLVLLLASVSPAAALVRAQQTTEPQGQFVPAESLPQRERMPAAPLLIGAYAFALVALFGYVISVSRRLGAVKTDIARLESDMKRSGRG
jgi:hypothetical protein